ncbi:MAG: hypothetical protein AB1515_01035 [Nitrospirota bacterium]
MARRFGEYLLDQKLLNEQQLAHALERQVTVGGRLGTNLVELGFLSDLELTRALSRHLNMAPAQPDVFDDIPADLIRLLSPELAQRHGAVPFQKEGRRTLCVAMADPSELAALDELKFAAGSDIKPFLAPEAKIEWALEKYYGLTRPLRHVSILGASAGMTLLNEHGEVDAERAEQTLPTVENFEHGLKLAYDELLHVKHRDEVVAVLLRESSRVADRALFFAIAEGRAIGLMGRGGGAMEEFLGLEIRLEQSPLLRHAVDKREAAVQPHSAEALGPALSGLLKNAPPRQIAAFPLTAAGHAVGVLYADTQQPGSFPCAELLQKLAAKGGMAMDMLILKKKILEL